MRSRKLINLSSDTAIRASESKYIFHVTLPSQHRFNRICLVRAMLPKSWYIVQAGQNAFTLHEDGAAPVDVTLPPGNYNRKSLATDVGNAMTAASPSNYTYTVTYPNAMIHGDDGKYTFTAAVADDDGGGPVAIILPDAKTSNMFELLGFDAGSTNIFDPAESSRVLKSRNVVKIQAEDTVRIHCNVCDNGGNDILAEIYALSSPTYSNVVYECSDILAYSKPLTNKHTTVYEFVLTNEADLPLQLNGLNFFFEILLFEAEP